MRKFNFGGLLDAFDMLPNDIATDTGMESLTREMNALRKWVEGYFDPERGSGERRRTQSRKKSGGRSGAAGKGEGNAV